MAVILEEKARNDEIGVLFHQYNQMLQRIVRLMKDIQESTQREKQAELRALQDRINPHFVFNTLDSINWIAMCEEEQEISLMVTSLANMLRYSILGEVNEAKLEDEITYLESTAGFQQLRYPDAFTISIEIDPALNGYKIPKMLLQPLVENAIVHNLGAHPEAGAGLYIRLTSQITEDRLILRVSNTGKGNFQLLNRYLQGQEDLIPKGKGFGIRNINRRIRLLYGEQYGLSYYPWLN